MRKKKADPVVIPEIEVARLNRDTALGREVISLLKQPLFQAITALVLLEALQKHQLIGQNVSTALEVAIATKETVGAIAPAVQAVGGLIPG